MAAANQRGSDHWSGLWVNVIVGSDPAAVTANLEKFVQAGGKIIDHWRMVSGELCEFGKWCLKRNREVTNNMSRCSSVGDVLEVQSEIRSRMAEAYIAETGRLAKITTQAIFDGLSAWNGTGCHTDQPAKQLVAAE